MLLLGQGDDRIYGEGLAETETGVSIGVVLQKWGSGMRWISSNPADAYRTLNARGIMLTLSRT